MVFQNRKYEKERFKNVQIFDTSSVLYICVITFLKQIHVHTVLCIPFHHVTILFDNQQENTQSLRHQGLTVNCLQLQFQCNHLIILNHNTILLLQTYLGIHT